MIRTTRKMIVMRSHTDTVFDGDYIGGKLCHDSRGYYLVIRQSREIKLLNKETVSSIFDTYEVVQYEEEWSSIPECNKLVEVKFKDGRQSIMEMKEGTANNILMAYKMHLGGFR